jgi:hypothetical protein
MIKAGTWISAHDSHFPKLHWPTFNVMLSFIAKNRIAGFVFGGDQFDNQEISHHTKSKPLFRERAAYRRNTENFKSQVLAPLVSALPTSAQKVWITGNHERFEQDMIEEQPELEGMIDHVELLGLREKSWNVIPLGHAFSLGKLTIIHGEILTGIGNQAGMFPSKKAVELYAGNVLAGHTHAPQSFTRISPVGESSRWMGWIAPILGATNPDYLRNRPTAWVNGFTIIEVRQDGRFNLFPIMVFKGEFTYGGRHYKS